MTSTFHQHDADCRVTPETLFSPKPEKVSGESKYSYYYETSGDRTYVRWDGMWATEGCKALRIPIFTWSKPEWAP